MSNTLKTTILNSTATVIVTAIVVAGLAGVGALTAPKSDASAVRATRVLPVATISAFPESGYAVQRQFVGRIEAKRQSRVGFELGGLSIKSLDRAIRARERAAPYGIDGVETTTDRALGIGRAEAKDRVCGLNLFEPHLAPWRRNQALSRIAFFCRR